jgi:hypothetical protein
MQADALYQTAERLHLQGRDAEALETLNRLQLEFEGTPAARRAGELRKAVTSASTSRGAPTPAAEREHSDPATSAQRAAEIRRIVGVVTGNPAPPAKPPAPTP